MSFDEKSLNFIYIFRNLFFFFYISNCVWLYDGVGAIQMNDERNKAIISMCCRFNGIKFACSTKEHAPIVFPTFSFSFIRKSAVLDTKVLIISSTGFSYNNQSYCAHSAHLSWIKIFSHNSNSFISISFQKPNAKNDKKEKKMKHGRRYLVVMAHLARTFHLHKIILLNSYIWKLKLPSSSSVAAKNEHSPFTPVECWCWSHNNNNNKTNTSVQYVRKVQPTSWRRENAHICMCEKEKGTPKFVRIKLSCSRFVHFQLGINFKLWERNLVVAAGLPKIIALRILLCTIYLHIHSTHRLRRT